MEIREIEIDNNHITGITHITCMIGDSWYHWQLYTDDYFNYLQIGRMECVRNSFERHKLKRVLDKIRKYHYGN